MRLLVAAGLDVVGPVAELGLARLDGEAGLAAVRLVGLANAAHVQCTAVLVRDLVGPFFWLSSGGQPMVFFLPLERVAGDDGFDRLTDWGAGRRGRVLVV